MTVPSLATLLEQARHTVALTGAGVSTESGIPDFRSDAGLWKEVDPMEVSSIDGFNEDPGRFYAFWSEKFASLAKAIPNDAHRLLAELESRGRLSSIVTQNIDGLHQKAGSRHVHEVHGSFRTVRCLACGATEPIETLFARADAGVPICTGCGEARLKPQVVLFGEMLPPAFGRAMAEARDTDLLLVMGSSLGVYPVAGLVSEAQRNGAKIVIINRDPTPFDEQADLVLHAELGTVSREIMSLLGA